MEFVIPGAVVTVAAIASHAFHSWLKLRERERLSAGDKAEMSKRLDDFERWRTDVKTFMANNRR